MPEPIVAVQSFKLALAEAVYIARSVLPAVSKDDVTPVITGSFWRFEGDTLTALSTDRYRVHRVVVANPGGGEGQALIPKRALQWLSANASFFGRARRIIIDPQLTVTITPAADWKPTKDLVKVATEGPRGKVTFTIAQNDSDDAETLSLTVDLIAGNYPPVGSLLDKALAADRIAPDGRTNLAQMAGLAAMSEGRENGRVEFVNASTNGNRSQMIVTFRRAAALIQQSSL